MPSIISMKIGFMNIKGQSKLKPDKQMQIEHFLKCYKCDILNLQETNIDSESFAASDFICSNYNIISNNAPSGYGTSCLVKTDFKYENLRCDTQGRIIIFDIEDMTFLNIYLPSGTDATAKMSRENICSNVLPNLLVNCKLSGCAGGDFNAIIDKRDATNFPENKMSKCLQRLVNLRNWNDSYRCLYPQKLEFSRYYENSRAEGASRIDRCYHFGDNVTVKKAKYIPVAFSDHFSLVVDLNISGHSKSFISPKCRPLFKMKPEVILDKEFKARLKDAMKSWELVKGSGNEDDILRWWEYLVKPGVRKIALERTKEINSSKREVLNLLLIRQAYVTSKLKQGCLSVLGELFYIHNLIENWYLEESKKVQLQSRVDEFQLNEKTSLYHHELHKEVLKRTSILQLSTDEGLIAGHDLCAKYLEKSVEELLVNPPNLDPSAQDILLNEVTTVFDSADNEKFLKPPSKEIVKAVLDSSNLLAAPGSDGVPSLMYKEHWDIFGDHLTEIMGNIFKGNKLPRSMRTSLMVFGAKPKKPGSILPKDKRRISLLNTDFKLACGLEARLFKSVATHTLSPLQLVAGDDRLIRHGINLTRNAIYAASRKNHPGCGILDTDLIAAFDWLCLDWSLKVLKKKGLDGSVIARIQNLYSENISIIVVNDICGKSIPNLRGSLRQGDLPSMHLFCYGIDPLITYLEKRLKGILISSTPIQGPLKFLSPPLRAYEERYKLIGYADDIKPAITSMEEFLVVDSAFALFERASGCKLHRDPNNKKCKFLPLARWRGTLQQEDIPCQYMTLSDHLEMVGVDLYANWSQTRKANGDIIQKRIDNTVRAWKKGKFMPLSQRSWSLNVYCFSKIWFRSHSVDLRELDFSKITSIAKSWMYGDMLLKPEEIVLYRPVQSGGLGLINIKAKALAGLIRSFLETACMPKYNQSLYHQLLFRYHVVG